jgi:hypothetical protein
MLRSSATPVLAFVGVALIALLAFAGGAGPEGRSKREAHGTPGDVAEVGLDNGEEAPDPVSLHRTRSPARRTEPAADTAALGTLRCELGVAPGASFPGRFECVARSSAGETVVGESEDPEGRLSLSLAPGTWEVHARAPGLASRVRSCDVQAGGPPAVFAEELLPVGTLRLCFEEEGAGPIDGLEVFLRASAGAATARSVTGPDGCARFDELFEGTYRVALGDPEFPTVAAWEIAFDTARPRPEVIVLPRLASLSVRVVDELGSPVAGARIEVLGRRGGRFRAITDMGGECSLSLVPTGLVRVVAVDKVHGSGDRASELSAGANPQLVVTLRR